MPRNTLIPSTHSSFPRQTLPNPALSASGKGRHSRNAERKKKSILDLGVSNLKLTAEITAKTFAFQTLERNLLC